MRGSADRPAPGRARRERVIAPFTGLFVFLCVSCSLAPLGVAMPVFLAAASCPASDACGESCPYEKAPRPSECRSCAPAGSAFLVEARQARGVPATSSASRLETTASPLLCAADAARIVAITASPPRHLLLAAFRN